MASIWLTSPTVSAGSPPPAAFDRTWDAAAAAIQLHAVTRSDPWSALIFAERARAAALTSRVPDSRPFEGAQTLRRELPPDVAVVFLSALDDAVLSWGMAREAESFHRAPIAYAELAYLTKRFRDSLQSDSRESFEPLGAPALRHRAGIPFRRHVARLGAVIAPDGPLLAVPFAALVEPSGRFLIEDRAVSSR